MASRPTNRSTPRRAPVRIPARGAGVTRITKRSGPTHGFQDDTRGPRIQKVLAESGIDSRRACEALVAEGRVTVNGEVLDGLPAWVNPQVDDIRVDGRRVESAERTVHVMLFKPKGVLSTNRDPEGRKLAIDLVQHPSKARLYPVGRLDIDSSGLLLLTNDGELANRLTHPRFELAKGYEVTVGGKVGEESAREIARLAGEVSVLRREAGRSLLYLEVREQRNAGLRRALASIGHPVKKLRRVRMGPLQLKGLQVGEWRDLTGRELAQLREAAFATPQQRARRRGKA